MGVERVFVCLFLTYILFFLALSPLPDLSDLDVRPSQLTSLGPFPALKLGILPHWEVKNASFNL